MLELPSNRSKDGVGKTLLKRPDRHRHCLRKSRRSRVPKRCLRAACRSVRPVKRARLLIATRPETGINERSGEMERGSPGLLSDPRQIVKPRDGLFIEDHFMTQRTAPVLKHFIHGLFWICLLYTSPSPRDRQKSRMPSSA